MEAVRYIFHEAANHQSLRSIEQELAERGVKAPRGGRLWRESMRKFIFYDVYKPHTFDELSEIVSPKSWALWIRKSPTECCGGTVSTRNTKGTLTIE
jgi:hypothetical protein